VSEPYCGCPDDLQCICDPTDAFDPPDPTPRAVEGCPAHRARLACQQLAAERPEGSDR
jgi:hypothetical protein